MKLISLNMEGRKHIDLIEPFLSDEAADVVCLYEAPKGYQHALLEHGYRYTSFAPVLIRDDQGPAYEEGVIIASRHQFTVQAEYYRHSAENIVLETKSPNTDTAHPLLTATISIDNSSYIIAATHVMVTANGRSDEDQRKGIDKLLSILDAKPPHVLCGDFNMPRGVNDQYERFTPRYQDAVPAKYTSSLDANLHRLGAKRSQLSDPIFDAYMVDYVFTQAPYTAHNVRLQFGVSDHAAIVATISKHAG